MKTFIVDVREVSVVTYRVEAIDEETAIDYYFEGDIIHNEFVYSDVVEVEVDE